VVEVAIVGVVKVSPVAKGSPPVAAANHFTTPPELVAPKTTEVLPQPVAGTVAVIVGLGVTVIVIGFVK
jgi:hypothetical protein